MYFIATALAMLADNIEHVISYWVIFQKFHSPTLGGFAVVSHWLPFLAFSVSSGALADRFDPRRIIQLGMVLFMCVSIAWGVLFFSGALQPWHARVLLIILGCAGVVRRSYRVPYGLELRHAISVCCVGRRSGARCYWRSGPRTRFL
jgi:MFS family permease